MERSVPLYSEEETRDIPLCVPIPKRPQGDLIKKRALSKNLTMLAS